MPFLRLTIFKKTFNLPKAIVFNTESERSLVNQIVKSEDQVQVVVGVGVNIPINFSTDRFRQSCGIKGDFLICMGRVDEAKNVVKVQDKSNVVEAVAMCGTWSLWKVIYISISLIPGIA